MHVHVCAFESLHAPPTLNFEKPLKKYSPETCFAKSPGGVHLILKQPKLNEGERAHAASIMAAK